MFPAFTFLLHPEELFLSGAELPGLARQQDLLGEVRGGGAVQFPQDEPGPAAQLPGELGLGRLTLEYQQPAAISITLLNRYIIKSRTTIK